MSKVQRAFTKLCSFALLAIPEICQAADLDVDRGSGGVGVVCSSETRPPWLGIGSLSKLGHSADGDLTVLCASMGDGPVKFYTRTLVRGIWVDSADYRAGYLAWGYVAVMNAFLFTNPEILPSFVVPIAERSQTINWDGESFHVVDDPLQPPVPRLDERAYVQKVLLPNHRCSIWVTAEDEGRTLLSDCAPDQEVATASSVTIAGAREDDDGSISVVWSSKTGKGWQTRVSSLREGFWTTHSFANGQALAAWWVDGDLFAMVSRGRWTALVRSLGEGRHTHRMRVWFRHHAYEFKAIADDPVHKRVFIVIQRTPRRLGIFTVDKHMVDKEKSWRFSDRILLHSAAFDQANGLCVTWSKRCCYHWRWQDNDVNSYISCRPVP